MSSTPPPNETVQLYAGAVCGWFAGYVSPFAALLLLSGEDTAAHPGLALTGIACFSLGVLPTSPLGFFGAAYAAFVRDRRGAAWNLSLTAAAGAYAAACAGWAALVLAWAVL